MLVMKLFCLPLQVDAAKYLVCLPPFCSINWVISIHEKVLDSPTFSRNQRQQAYWVPAKHSTTLAQISLQQTSSFQHACFTACVVDFIGVRPCSGEYLRKVSQRLISSWSNALFGVSQGCPAHTAGCSIATRTQANIGSQRSNTPKVWST